jgi:adenine-specific DNA-methyltransferase
LLLSCYENQEVTEINSTILDYNIKVGNSLISKLNTNDAYNQFSTAQRQKIKQILPDYKKQVTLYKGVSDKEAKMQITNQLKKYKHFFDTLFNPKDVDYQNYKSLENKWVTEQLSLHQTEQALQKLYEDFEAAKEKWEAKTQIYNNSFEWRFEFPEILDDEGNFVGFDVVVGNPPYISLQRMWLRDKDALQSQNYQTFESTGDIYMLFYEKGISLLKNNGLLAYVTSRQWMQANYGKVLRKYLSENTNPLQLIDFGQSKVFDNATVFVNILLTEKAANQYQTQTYLKEKENEESKWLDSVTENFTERKDLGIESWTLSNTTSYQNAIKKKGIAIVELIQEEKLLINRGITTGFNDAFHIQQKDKDKLLAADAKNADIIKPLLRGKDIKRYNYQFDSWYIINAHNGIRETNVPRIDVVRDYPHIYEHLQKYEKELVERQDKGEHWTNLRNCAFLEEFEKPKIVWIEISDRANYAYDDKGMYQTIRLTASNICWLFSIPKFRIITFRCFPPK